MPGIVSYCHRETAAIKRRDVADVFLRLRTGGRWFHKIAQLNSWTGKKDPHPSGCIVHPSSSARIKHYPDLTKETIASMLLGSK